MLDWKMYRAKVSNLIKTLVDIRESMHMLTLPFKQFQPSDKMQPSIW